MNQARQQIHEALLSYTRGIDRLRADDVRGGFHAGALLHGYGSAEAMPIEAFADYAVRALADRYDATQHRLSNTRIEFVDDHTARVETYVEASHREPPSDDGTQRLHTFAGRYIDRCAPDDDGVWRIAERVLRNDWSKVEVIDQPMRGAYVPSGRGEGPDATPDPLDDF
ncbi:MAG: nuclear transport factor 2 family protein [Actinomycetota bacterium]